MKLVQYYIILFFLLLIVGIESIQLVNSKNQQSGEGDSFLPMVYENQIAQAASTDGLEIINPEFHQLLNKKQINQPMLILRYSGLSCKGCVQSCLSALRRQFPNYEANNRILIVVSDVSASQIPANSLVLNAIEVLGYDLEGTRIPHFFVYDPMTQKIQHTFVPDQSDLNAIPIYLSTISGRYGL